MKTWKLFLIAFLALSITNGAITYLVVKIANEVDNNGGLKFVVERIWEGNKK